jgi:hypothetical protein
MRNALWLLFFVCAATRLPVIAPAQVRSQNDCRIVDFVMKNTGEVDYVDGKRVPGKLVDLFYLQEQEKSSPRSCLALFVTSSAKIRDIEGTRVIAGKMGYKDFHAYLYEPNRDSASEILYGPDIKAEELRSSPNGPIPWPDGPKR